MKMSSRVVLNVSGEIFETRTNTLHRFTDTLLGDDTKLNRHYCHTSQQYFFDRNRLFFDAILFFYQSNGVLACPAGLFIFYCVLLRAFLGILYFMSSLENKRWDFFILRKRTKWVPGGKHGQPLETVQLLPFHLRWFLQLSVLLQLFANPGRCLRIISLVVVQGCD